MVRRIRSLALTLTLLPTACGDDKGGASETTTEGTTGGSTMSASTATDGTGGSGTHGTGGSGTDGSTSDPTTGAPDPKIEEDCLAAREFDLQASTYSCNCEVMEGNYPNLEWCLEAIGEDPASHMSDACECEQFGADPSNAGVEECRRAKFQAFAECLTPLMCSDSNGRQACFDAFLDGACEFASDESYVQIEFQCKGAKPFMCGSGETIPDTWVCDLLEQCMDKSDEQNC